MVEKMRRYRDTDGVTEVWKILRYSVVRLNDKMFDIVNREYEENGSFRCDFVATKERDRELVVLWFCRVLPLRKPQNS